MTRIRNMADVVAFISTAQGLTDAIGERLGDPHYVSIEWATGEIEFAPFQGADLQILPEADTIKLIREIAAS